MNHEDYLKFLEIKHEVNPNHKITIDGIGTIKIYGELNHEKFIKKFLENENVVGR